MPGIDHDALRDLAADYSDRQILSTGTWDAGGQRIKSYAIAAAGRTVESFLLKRARELASAQTALDRQVGGLGLAVAISHAGGDGDYVIVLSWAEQFMSRMAIFCGPVDDPAALRPAPSGLAPCVWELAVLAHERDAYHRLLLAGPADTQRSIVRWSRDVLTAQPTHSPALQRCGSGGGGSQPAPEPRQ